MPEYAGSGGVAGTDTPGGDAGVASGRQGGNQVPGTLGVLAESESPGDHDQEHSAALGTPDAGLQRRRQGQPGQQRTQQRRRHCQGAPEQHPALHGETEHAFW